MAFKKRTSPAVDKAEKRVAAFKSIHASLDLGNGKTLAAYEAKLVEVNKALEEYNTQLSVADGLKNVLEAKQRELANLSQEMLAGIGSMYGFDSSEYEKAGGVRKSNRKRSARQTVDKP